MLRRFVCGSVGRRIAAGVALSLAFGGTQSLMVSAFTGPANTPVVGATWRTQALDRNGRVIEIKSSRDARSPALKPSAEQMDAMWQRAVAAKASLDPKLARWGERTLNRLKIVSSKSVAERHERIRQLPVSIVVTLSTDGRVGKVKNYIAGGKTRFRVFVPEEGPVADSSAIDPNEPPVGGPHEATALTGRWKLGGVGDCYWDPNDSGPDQCDSDGRWKSDGQGGCYWDEYDGGPDQCTPPANTCFDGEADPCYSQQDMEDLLVYLADAEAEIDDLQTEYDAQQAALTEWCNQHPGSCAGPDENSGPNLHEEAWPCVEQAANATGAHAVAAGTWLLAWTRVGGAIRSGVALSAAEGAGHILAVTGASYFAGYYMGYLVACVVETYNQLLVYLRPTEEGESGS
jgi:hypothetical protein